MPLEQKRTPNHPVCPWRARLRFRIAATASQGCREGLCTDLEWLKRLGLRGAVIACDSAALSVLAGCAGGRLRRDFLSNSRFRARDADPRSRARIASVSSAWSRNRGEALFSLGVVPAAQTSGPGSSPPSTTSASSQSSSRLRVAERPHAASLTPGKEYAGCAVTATDWLHRTAHWTPSRDLFLPKFERHRSRTATRPLDRSSVTSRADSLNFLLPRPGTSGGLDKKIQYPV